VYVRCSISAVVGSYECVRIPSYEFIGTSVCTPLDLAFWDYFVIVYLCMCVFVVLDLVSSVLCQEIVWEELRQNDLTQQCVVLIFMSPSVLLGSRNGIQSVKTTAVIVKHFVFEGNSEK